MKLELEPETLMESCLGFLEMDLETIGITVMDESGLQEHHTSPLQLQQQGGEQNAFLFSSGAETRG